MKSMKKKINLQFIVITLTAILVTVSLVSVVFYDLFKREVLADLSEYTHLLVETDIGRIDSDPEHINPQIFNEDELKIRITIIAVDGTAVLDTNAEIGSMENHSDRPEIAKAIETGCGEAIRNSTTVGKNTFYYAIRLQNGYVLRVAKETSNLTSVFISVFPMIGILCIALFIACILLSRYLTKSIIEPIDLLADNLDGTDSIRVYDELRPFVKTIKTQHEDIMKNANIRQEFTANVSHELKTPLTSISGYSELIESDMAGEVDIKRFAKEIHKSSNRLLTLINDIIRLSQLDQIVSDDVYEEVDLYEIAQSSIDMLQLTANRNNVTIKLTGSEQKVTANRQMMDELIFNLCDNAIRYNKPEGKVNVTVSKNSNNEIYVEVRDTGIGISKENQERIFERFYRVDKSRSKATGGTGLGLAIVKHILAHHANARLELESELEQGTCIKIIFADEV